VQNASAGESYTKFIVGLNKSAQFHTQGPGQRLGQRGRGPGRVREGAAHTYQGKTVTLRFLGAEDSSLQTLPSMTRR
jgi:hypothetical protein